jgi:hypothetical protein
MRTLNGIRARKAISTPFYEYNPQGRGQQQQTDTWG